ncbi:MAG: hypothetical protein IPL63_01180 [Saprospiraceae bacterium]|nr:hypothetical protein [Saprospiraceae bacterium]MBK8371105.1 hypothetical protein [Saprospiraceae bacterium]MBK8546036.1 hypothetical protein [Saprospiraceae bacterium]MBK8854064.1 hypothetical protein [Saprospiraceae bacterium]
MSFLHVTTKILLVLSILLVFASCEKEEVINKQNSDNELIVGYWLLSKGETFATNSKGEKIVTATLNPKIFAHEFLADGTYINHNLTSTSSTERGTWKVEVKKKDEKDIEEGILSITTPSTLANKGMLFFDNDGSIKFSITSTYKRISDKKSVLYLETKKYEAYPYNENWAYYIFEKQ